jgi:hypothetical protein
MQTRLQQARVYVETAEYAITGYLTFPEVSRLSDILNSADRRFLALTDITAVSKSNGQRSEHAFLALAVQHVVIAMQMNDAGALDDHGEPCGLAWRMREPSELEALTRVA